jgi:hypothetical protein
MYFIVVTLIKERKTATFFPLAFARLRAKVIFIRIKTRSRSTFVPLAFARLRAKVIFIFIRIQTLALQPCSYFDNYKNSNS